MFLLCEKKCPLAPGLAGAFGMPSAVAVRMPAECLPSAIPRTLSQVSTFTEPEHFPTEVKGLIQHACSGNRPTHNQQGQSPVPTSQISRILDSKASTSPHPFFPQTLVNTSRDEGSPLQHKRQDHFCSNRKRLKKHSLPGPVPWIWRRVQWCPKALASGTQPLICTTQPEGKVVGGASGLYLTWS